MLILVVDDEISLCELMADILAEQFTIIMAYNGKEALALAQAHKPDLIISDVMMPHMSGVELLRALRTDPVINHIPMVLLSAGNSGQAVMEANAFIQKPFEIEVLEKTVARFTRTNHAELNLGAA
ncbi:MAG: response regulator [Chloroflexota bacterium]|nr:response regulator [Chloroflexota bacterium]